MCYEYLNLCEGDSFSTLGGYAHTDCVTPYYRSVFLLFYRWTVKLPTIAANAVGNFYI